MKRTEKKANVVRAAGEKGKIQAVKAVKGQKTTEKPVVAAKTKAKAMPQSVPPKTKASPSKTDKKQTGVKTSSAKAKSTATKSKVSPEKTKAVPSKPKAVPNPVKKTSVKSKASLGKAPKKVTPTPAKKTSKAVQKQETSKSRSVSTPTKSANTSTKAVKTNTSVKKAKGNAASATQTRMSSQKNKDIKPASKASNKKPKASQAPESAKSKVSISEPKAKSAKAKGTIILDKTAAKPEVSKSPSTKVPKQAAKAGVTTKKDTESKTTKVETPKVKAVKKENNKDAQTKSPKEKSASQNPPTKAVVPNKNKNKTEKGDDKAKKKTMDANSGNEPVIDVPIVEPIFHIDEDDDDLSMLTAAQKKLRKKELEKRRVAAEKVANKLRAKQKRLEHVFIKPEMDPSILTANRITKEFLELKYSFDCEPRDLMLALTKAEYMRNWLAERVELDDKSGVYSFYWRNYSESARIVEKVQDRYIKWQWVGIERPANEFLIFSIDIIPGDSYVDLYILDICEPGDREIMTKGWDKLMDRLRVIVT